MVESEMRNQMIVDDVVKSHESGGNCLVLTERTSHLELLAGKLRKRIPEVMTLQRRKGNKGKRRNFQAHLRNTCGSAIDLGRYGQVYRGGIRRTASRYPVSDHADIVERDSTAICGQTSQTVCRKKRGPDLRLCRYPW